MKKLVILLTAIILLSACSNDDTNSQNPEEIIELKTLLVNIELPNNSSISESDLTVSSLFSESILISNGTSEIESFDDDTMELTFATNQQGNIVMLSYFNPLNNEIVEMNSESTATALVLLHPWSFDLTANAKAEAIEFIKSLPEFDSYKLEIENSLASGELNPLNSQSVLEKVTEIQQITFSRTTEYIEPLEFDIQNSTASVKNVLSSATYSIGLYDENDVLFEHKPAQGLDKSHFLFQEFKNNVFQESNSDKQTATFNIPTDGDWTLKAKSGLSFDGSLENQQAAYYNTKTIVANAIGIFSTKLKSLMIKNDCLVSVGELVYNGVSGSIDISSSIQSYSNGSLSGYGLTKNVTSFLFNNFNSVFSFIENCTDNGTIGISGLDKLKSGPFGKILGFLNILGNLENVFNSTAMLTDWVQYDKEIEFCFTKNGNEIEECSGDLFSDAVIIREFLEINGIDVSDPRWYSQNIDDIFEILTENDVSPGYSLETPNSQLRVRTLYLEEKGITIVPNIIFELTELTTLGFTNAYSPDVITGVANSISTIPESIGNLTKLKTLHLINVGLSSLPESIGNLENIENILLLHNNLTTLPTSIGNITQLKEINASNNNLVNIPSSIGNLTNLRTLRLYANNLTSLPSTISDLANLEQLSIWNNNLSSLPSSIGNLNNLNSLSFSYNPNLNCLPQVIWDMDLSWSSNSYLGTAIVAFGDTNCSN